MNLQLILQVKFKRSAKTNDRISQIGTIAQIETELKNLKLNCTN